jgi:hypothetical protein
MEGFFPGPLAEIAIRQNEQVGFTDHDFKGNKSGMVEGLPVFPQSI